MEIDITNFFNNADAFQFSHSQAEGGKTAGPDTWNAAKREGSESPLLKTEDQIAALRLYVCDFGAWSAEEIAAWDATECNALFIQIISGDMREAGLDNEPDDEAWAEYERRSEEGNCSSNIFRSSDRVYYSLDR